MKAERRSTPRTVWPALWTIFLLIPLAVVAQGSDHAGTSDWTNIGPEGGSFQFLTVDPQNPDTIYAATATGLFKSIDGAASWNNSGLNGFGVSALIIDPQQPTILYAAASTNGPDEGLSIHVFKSTDGGASWNKSESGLPANFVPRAPGALAIDPQNSSTLYASVGQGLFKSSDAGANWLMIYQPPDGREFYDITIDPNTPGTLYAASVGPDDVPYAVFKSMDGGTTSSEPDAGFDAVAGLSIDPTNPATMYTVSQEGMYMTTDGAANWHAVNGLPIQSFLMEGLGISGDVIIDHRDAKTLYITFAGLSPFGAPGALFKSTDGGASWHAAGRIPGLQGGSKALAIDQRNSSTLYAATSNGVYRSIDGGLSFSPYSQARAVPLTSVALDPQRSGTVLAGGLGTSISSGGAIYRSTDAGRTWLAPATNLSDVSGVALAIDPQNPNNVYAGTGNVDCGQGTSTGIFESADGGMSWIDTQSGIGCVSAIVIDPRTAGTVYAANYYNGGVNKSTDGARSWNAMNSGLPPLPPPDTHFGPRVTALTIDPQNTGTLFAGANGVFKSIDGGATWVGANSGIPSFPFPSVSALAVDPQTPRTVYAAMAPQYGIGGLWKSIDGGTNWRNVFPANVYALAINPRNPSTIYAGAENGLAQSRDGGETWSIIPGGPGRVTVLALDPQDPNTVYAGGQGGLFASRPQPSRLPERR